MASSAPVNQQPTHVIAADTDEALPAALAALRAGGVVAFPTDTVYGVGCDLWCVDAIEQLYWSKQRPRELAIPILVSHPAHVAQVARDLPPDFEAVVGCFWPGGLTVIVPKKDSVPDALSGGRDTVAVRMPDHPAALRLIEAMGGALAVTSANLSGRPAPASAAEVLAELDGRVSVLIDGGVCPGGVASTIISLVSTPPVLLRQGGIAPDVLRQVLGEIAVPDES